MEGWQIIQECELGMLTGLYDQERFIQLVSVMTKDEFNRFCRQHLYLSLFHAQNQNLWVTDDTDIIRQHPQLFWKIEPINFDAPINFRRVK